MNKISFFDKRIICKSKEDASFFLGILGLILAVSNKYGFVLIGLSFLCCIVNHYLLWKKACNLCEAKFIINGMEVNVIEGDIFKRKANELNVIGFNEFYDTIVDNVIISHNSLRGRFIDLNPQWINDLNENIDSGKNIIRMYEPVTAEERPRGKKIKYELGSLLEYKGFILTALSKFKRGNQAMNTPLEYEEFWLNFWDNIEHVHAGRTINLPIMGTGLMRMEGKVKPDKQEMLEIAIMNLYISGFQCTAPGFKINFLIYKDDMDSINFYRLKNKFHFVKD